jgi:hypothetical protein
VQPAVADLAAGADDGVGHVVREEVQLLVGQRGGFLDGRQRVDQVRVLRHRDPRDGEVLGGAQRLHAVVQVHRELALAQQVVLGAQLAGKVAAPPTAEERVGVPEARRDHLGRGGHQLAVELRVLAGDEGHGVARDLHELGILGHHAAGGVRVVVQQAPLAERLALGEEVQHLRPPVEALYDLHPPLHQHPERAARLALAEDVGARRAALGLRVPG